jgi:hypothetical protein
MKKLHFFAFGENQFEILQFVKYTVFVMNSRQGIGTKILLIISLP